MVATKEVHFSLAPSRVLNGELNDFVGEEGEAGRVADGTPRGH